MSKTKDKFLKKCQDQSADDSRKIIKRGSLKWFVGRPTSAENEFGALVLPDGVTITFSANDIKASEQTDDDGMYRIGLDPEATIILTQQRVMKLSECDCQAPDDNDGFVPTRFGLDKVVGFPIDRVGGLFGGGLLDAGYVDPCVATGRRVFNDCLYRGGRPFGECFYASKLVEDQCRRQFF